MKLMESWRQSLDSRNYSGAVLIDISKAFNTINHDLLIIKLHAYGFNKKSQEQRFVIISVLGLKSYRVFHKVLF